MHNNPISTQRRPIGVTLLAILCGLNALVCFLLLLRLGIGSALSSTSIWLTMFGSALLSLAVFFGFMKGLAWSWWLFGFSILGMTSLFFTVGICVLLFGVHPTIFGMPISSTGSTSEFGDLIEGVLSLFGVGLGYAYLCSHRVLSWFNLANVSMKKAALVHIICGAILGAILYFLNAAMI